MENKPRWILWIGIAVGAILIFVVGGFVGALVYHELRPAREVRSLAINPVAIGQAKGITVLEVVADGPAEDAGIVPGDTLLQIDDTTLDAATNIADLIAAHKPGDEIRLTVRHSGSSEDTEVKVTLGENPDESGTAYLGIRYRPVSAAPLGWLPPAARDRRMDPGRQLPDILKNYDKLKSHLKFLESCSDFRIQPEDSEAACGLLVAQVAAGSPAEKAGLVSGDMILALDGEDLTTRQAFMEAIQAHQPGDRVSLTLYHLAGETQSEVDVTLGESPDTAGQAYLGVTVPGFYFDFGQGTWPPFQHMPEFRQPQPESALPSSNT